MGRNLGRAIASIGDDVLAWSQLQQQGRLREAAEALRDQRERDIAELRARVQQMGIEARASRGVAGAGREPLSDEQLAARAGLTAPDFQAGREFNRTGPQSETKAFADTSGMEYLAPADRADLEAKGGMRGETQGTIRGRQHSAAARAAVVSGSMDEKDLDDFVVGFESVRATQDPSLTPEQRAKRIAAAKGGDMRKAEGGEVIDPFEQPTGTTPAGKAKIARDNAQTARTAAGERQSQQLRAADGTVRNAQQQLDTEMNAAARALRDNPASIGWDADRRDEWVQSRPAVQEARKALREAQRRRDAVAEGDDIEQGFRNARGGAAPANSAPYPDGTRLRGRDGKVYVVRGGRPVVVER